MAEQQLVDYITKARSAAQADSQTRNLLSKNGWTDAEINDAFLALDQAKPQVEPQAIQPEVVAAQSQPEVQPEVQPETQAETQPQPEQWPELETQPEAQPQPQVQVQPQPVVQPQPSAMPAQDNIITQTKVKSHKVLKLLMVLIILIIICGAGYFVAGQYFNFSWNFFAPSPETVINKMLQNMGDGKTYHTVSQIELDITDNATKTLQGKLILNTNSESDITDVKNPKSDGNFTVKLTLPGVSTPVASASVSMVYIGNAFYLELNNITMPNSFSYPGLNISQINGKWFEIDQDSVSAISQAKGIQLALPDISQMNNSGMIQKIQSLVATENIFSNENKLNDETISGQDTYHYSVVVAKDKLKDLVTKIISLGVPATTQAQNTPTNNSGIAVENITQNMAQVFASSLADGAGNLNIELWIGKKDYMLYQYKVDKDVDLTNTLGMALTLGLNVDSTNSNFNKPITVQAPIGSQKIETIILPLLKSNKESVDLTQIGVDAQSLFGASQSYASLCTKGLLNGYLANYGTDLINMNNSIVSSGAKKPACFSATQDYCVSTQMPDSTYLCIDKNNVLGTTNCTSAQTVCK